MARFKDLTGLRFGRLVVVKRSNKPSGRKDGPVTWVCVCDCGNHKDVRGPELRTGDTQSCGCLFKEVLNEVHTTHGLRKHPLYSKYYRMYGRCYDPNNNRYYRYGARGIKICDEWRSSFNIFFEWCLNSGWEPGLTIERKDNDGDYCPNNCCWIPLRDQQKNTSRSIINKLKVNMLEKAA